MNHRQKLEDLQNEIASTSATKLSAGLRDRWASAIYTILADWPEDAKVMTREASTPRRVFHGSLITGD